MISKPFLVFLLIVFGIHFAIFMRLALRDRKLHQYLAAVTFVLLLIATGLRIASPQAHLGSFPLYAYFKYTAWLTTAALIVAYLRQRYHK